MINKEGTYAILIKSRHMGYIVKVVKFRGVVKTLQGESISDAWQVEYHKKSLNHKEGTYFVAPDSSMVPVSGIFDPDAPLISFKARKYYE